MLKNILLKVLCPLRKGGETEGKKIKFLSGFFASNCGNQEAATPTINESW